MAYDKFNPGQTTRKEYTTEEKIEYICKKNWAMFNSILDIAGNKATTDERSELIWAWAENMVTAKQERQFKRPTA